VSARVEGVGALRNLLDATDAMRAVLDSEAHRYHKDHDHPDGITSCTHRSCWRVRKTQARYDRAREALDDRST
jgi:hypothetical protein